MTVSQKVQIVTFDQGPSLSDVTVKSLLTDSTVTGGTADSCPEIATDAGVYVAEFVNADAAALIPAGAYRLRAVIGGAPLNRYVTLKGVDGEVAYSTDVPPASSSGISVANVTKSLDDTGPITFSWPVTGAVITAQVSIDNGLYQAAQGTFAFLRTDEPGIHYYTLSFDADDRPTAEGTARYKLIDGSGIRGYINLSMNVSSSGGGDLEEIKGPGWDEDTDTLEKIRDAIAAISTLSVVIPSPVAEVIGMPETLEIGDSYDDETPIKLYIRDDADDPVTVFSGHDLADSDFAPTFVIAPTPGNPRGRVKGNVTYVPASGPDEGYLKIEIPSLQSRRAVEGESSVQCVLKWDGYEKTLLNTTVRWLPRI